MPTYSVSEAKNQLSRLIDLAVKGEEVIITRHGQPAVELRAIPPKPRRMTDADLEWLRARRVTPSSATEDAGQIVSKMRDEEQR
jgi:antitoxin (DNA-binding transcriptional repressor) of toxin-antitoxin stability system